MQRAKEHHLYLGLVYIPPKGSAFESQCDSLPAYDILQQDIADICANEGLILLAGDFNARTSCLNEDSIQQDFSANLQTSTLAPLASCFSSCARPLTCAF